MNIDNASIKEIKILIEIKEKEKMESENKGKIEIQNKEGLEYLSGIKNNSIDLVLTDPPYITSSETGMGNLYKQIEENKKKGIKYVKSIDNNKTSLS